MPEYLHRTKPYTAGRDANEYLYAHYMKNIFKTFQYTILLVSISLNISCGKEVKCSDGVVALNFIDYTSKELDTLMVRKYKPDNPQELVEETKLVKGFNVNHTINGDTITVESTPQFSIAGFITQYSNWQVYIPSVNRTISITSIEGETHILKTGTFTTNVVCRNKIYSCLVDGVKVIFPKQITGYELGAIYIKR